MVTRKSRIGKKPSSSATSVNPDNWVKKGGIDPEAAPAAPSVEQPAPETEDKKGKGAFPHRISLDMDTPQYKRLKYAAFDSERAMNEILREAVEDWMKARNY